MDSCVADLRQGPQVRHNYVQTHVRHHHQNTKHENPTPKMQLPQRLIFSRKHVDFIPSSSKRFSHNIRPTNKTHFDCAK